MAAMRNTLSRRRFIQFAAAGCGGVARLGVAQPSSGSDKVVRWVLGFATGGGTDVLARSLAPLVGAQLGMSIVVENKPGANGNIAAEYVAHAAPDGLTFLYNTSSLVTSPALYSKVRYDPLKDFVPVAPVANVPLLLVAHPSLPPNNLAEFIAYAKANPDKLTYASAGSGNVTHLSNLLFLQTVGISAMHVPYKGGGPALNDLLGGHVQFYMDTSNTSIPFVQKKLLKAYASTGRQRLAALPEVPTVGESVSPGFDTGSWTGLVAPAKTPADAVARMNKALRAVQQEAAAAPIFAQQAAEARSSTPEEYGAFLRSEQKRWGDIIRKHAIHID
jgi:tripartite-type tricarboxylate transporter receptor subunit TctC